MGLIMKNPYKPYWFVFDQKGSKPKHRHRSEDAAIDEAERLAQKHPKRTFHVLMVIGKVERGEWIDFCGGVS
jgi:hypothetical protein